MKIFRILLINIAIFSAFHSSALAQTDTIGIKTLIDKTNKALNDYPAEKVYLHFDKPYYAVADTVWFKAYITENQNFLSGLSKIVYVDVINQRDSLIQTIKLPVVGGTASGNFPLPLSNFKQGNYHVRAYTMWMLNSEFPAYFNKSFYVGEAIDKELKTHITFKNASTDKLEKIDARIQFKDANNKPYANKSVTWKVVTKGEIVTKGKGTTDIQGFLVVPMSANQNAEYQLQKGELLTSINSTEKDVINSTFQLKNAIISKDFQFFPEGGNLIEGLNNRVAFKALKSDGSGINAKGIITDNDGKQVATFTAQHLGMGSFTFTPESGKTYKASITYADGSTQTLNLPATKSDGIAITVDNSNAENIDIKITANESFFQKNKGKVFYLLAQSQGVICYGAKTELTNKDYNTTISKTKFPNGITQLTLFNEYGKVLSERLAFIQHLNKLSVNLTTSAPSYGTKKKVKINVVAKKDNLPVVGNFSVAVVDETKVPFNEDGATTILTTLLLNSDVKGYIERANYYFNAPDAKKNADLDVLLLTQGYRSYSYSDIVGNTLPKIAFLPEQGIDVYGILRMSNGIPVRKGTLLLTIPDKRFSLEGTTDPVGNFKFQNLVLNDTSKVTISAKYNVNYKAMTLSLNGTPTPSTNKNFNVAEEILNIDSTLNTYLDNSKKQYAYLHTLKDITIKAKAVDKPSHKDFSALSGLSTIADHEISGDQFAGCNAIVECLKSLAPGVTYDNYNFYVSRDYNQGKKVPMGIFVNGMMLDFNALSSVNPAQIESVEVFLKDELGLVNRTYQVNGVIVINSKKAAKGQKITKSQLLDMLPKNYEITFTPMGYNKAREFYSPKYITPTSLNRNDLRTTIYWNPKIITDEAGNASFEFYNADGKGQYKVIIEGIDGSGNLGRTILRYTVK
ncbi:carboxypeptidase regulatory-like domain-containing protein [Pedobacter changchengzhani]|uniref:carboxypeptidase regulatory-like domain-containing protein n=1 Tax=Pedobacter changchengzhani TaxID=2529274 RepID=UPI001FB63663|nr:carboxypeptidase regulatory-like domain-containing protein [Pedobacter changchengzhani]